MRVDSYKSCAFKCQQQKQQQPWHYDSMEDCLLCSKWTTCCVRQQNKNNISILRTFLEMLSATWIVFHFTKITKVYSMYILLFQLWKPKLNNFLWGVSTNWYESLTNFHTTQSVFFMFLRRTNCGVLMLILMLSLHLPLLLCTIKSIMKRNKLHGDHKAFGNEIEIKF